MADRERLLSQFYLQVDGLPEPRGVELMGDLVELTVESSLHLPDVATVIVHDSKLSWLDDPALEPGKALTVSGRWGQHDREETLFDGEIVELEPDFGQSEQRLVIRAFDRLHRVSRGRYVRSFLNVTDGDLVQKIAAEVGLEAKVAPTSQVHPYVLQNNETNLAFLQGRAAAIGYLVFVRGKTLHVEPPTAAAAPVELKWAETLKDFRPRMTTVAQITTSTARGWDPTQRQPIVGQATQGNGTPQVGEKRQGGAVAQKAFGVDAPCLTADRPIRTQGAADRLAQAVADRHASRFIEADGACVGNGKIVAGVPLDVGAVGDRFSGTYLVTSARHVYTPDEGYTTHFSISGQHPSTLLNIVAPEAAPVVVPGLVIALVTDNNDPEGQGRVKVKYPWLSPDHASDWARVVSVGGGPQRGIEFLPEINDEVLVGFELGDVHHPYVLGGLWNGVDAPPVDKGKVVSGGKVQLRVIRSRAGHTITIDDTGGAGGVTVEDKNGNRIVLDSGANAVRLTSQGDITLDAKANLTLKASGQVSVRAGGTVDVRGSVINLN